MKKVVSKGKLSKKAKRELAAKNRAVWAINPVTRSAPNPKAYNRKKLRIEDGDFDRSFSLEAIAYSQLGVESGGYKCLVFSLW